MVDPKEHLLSVIDAYQAATGVSDTTISYRVFSDSKRLRALRGSHSITSARLVLALQWLSDRWPDGAAWPGGVERPARNEAAA